MPQARWAITGTGVYWTLGAAGAVSTPRLEPPTGSEVEDARGTRGLLRWAYPGCQHLSRYACGDTEMRALLAHVILLDRIGNERAFSDNLCQGPGEARLQVP